MMMADSNPETSSMNDNLCCCCCCYYCIECSINLIKLPWIKCKNFILKSFRGKNKSSWINSKANPSNTIDNNNRSLFSNHIIDNNHRSSSLSSSFCKNNLKNSTNDSSSSNSIIKCPNCQFKSKSINGFASLLQLSSSSTAPFTDNISNRLMPTSRSQPSTPAASINNGETKNMQKTRRSPSDYCRVATCEKLHIHDVTPKCLETFAPSSTCSSCQQCDQQHIGPNHSQLLLIKRLMKELPIIESMNNNPLPNTRSNTNTNNSNTNHNTLQSTAKQQQQSNTPIATTCLLMQWPLPEYRPQNSPVHLYRKIVI